MKEAVISDEEHLLRALLIVREKVNKGQVTGGAGLCSLTTNIMCHLTTGILYTFSLENTQEILKQLFTQWPKFTGNTDYPVPGGYKEYRRASIYNVMWEGKYGELRMELLNFCIDTLQNKLEQTTSSEEGYKRWLQKTTTVMMVIAVIICIVVIL